MPKHGKKFRAAQAQIDPMNAYDIDEALHLVKQMAFAAFDEAIDASINLNVNPRHADQMVRGSVVLPHGQGKETRVAVFAKGEKAKEAEEAGADLVGAEDLVARIQEENLMDFDVAVATPDMMGQVGRIGRILGPRGLMPNPKAGTVTMDVAKIVRELKAGRVEFRVDKAGIIHISFGRRSFDEARLRDNLVSVIEALARLRPASAKAPYFRNITVSSTMGPGVNIDTTFATNTLR